MPPDATLPDALPDDPAGAPADDADARRGRTGALVRRLVPLGTLLLALVLWDRLVAWNAIPPYILPSPTLVARTMVADAPLLLADLYQTLAITLLALLLAVLGGVGLAVLFAQSRLIERSLSPFAVIVQVTPVVAVAPLIRIYVEAPVAQLLLCAWIVAFFPILSNTTLGLNSADHGLRDLFRLYGASRWQRLRLLQLPSALPFLMAGLRVAGGLALIGAVVAEFVIGVGGTGHGLAARILESGYRLNIPRLYAALATIALAGVAIHLATGWLAHAALRRWHESALGGDG